MKIYKAYNDIPFEQVTAPINKAYLKYMMDGIERGIQNVHAHVYVLLLDGHLIPFSVNDGLFDDSWIHSLRAQYIDEMVSEAGRMNLKPAQLAGARAVLNAGRKGIYGIDRTITVYPSFMSTTLYEDKILPIKDITDVLTKAFPKHALLFRTVNTTMPSMQDNLVNTGYRPVVSRAVYIYDAEEKHSKNERKDLKKDIKKLDKSGYTVTDALEDKDFERLLELYNQVYIEKYSKHNPHYTADFFKFLYEEMDLKWFIIKNKSEIIAFMGVQQVGDTLFPAYFGMDQSPGLYFMTSGLLYKEANERNLKINNSAGAKDYKLARGSRPFMEYHYIYTKHLPKHAQMKYQLLHQLMTPVGTYLLKKLQFS